MTVADPEAHWIHCNWTQVAKGGDSETHNLETEMVIRAIGPFEHRHDLTRNSAKMTNQRGS